MNEKQFNEMVSQVLEKLSEGPDSHHQAMEQLVQKHNACKDLRGVVENIQESMQSVRIVLKYLIFDIEATRRERDELRTTLEDQE